MKIFAAAAVLMNQLFFQVTADIPQPPPTAPMTWRCIYRIDNGQEQIVPADIPFDAGDATEMWYFPIELEPESIHTVSFEVVGLNDAGNIVSASGFIDVPVNQIVPAPPLGFRRRP